jgi:3-hydroxymyristoyl/3-hydroxydecanoyl-(acyl carrier protein) dehydratase
MLSMCAGNYADVLGPAYDQQGKNPGLVFSSPKMLMIERITKLDPTGGAWGLGLMEGEKTLDPEHWYFPCHFKDDEVMAGSLMSDGCGQLLRFYTLWLGLQTKTDCARFQPLPNEPQKVRCRGQVTPQHGTLQYRMEVTEIGLEPYPYAKANIDIILDGKIVTDFKNLGLYLKDGYAEFYQDGENISQSRKVVELPGAAVDVERCDKNALIKPGTNPVSAAEAFTGGDYPWLQQGMKSPTYAKGFYEPRNPPFKPLANNPNDNNCVPDTLPYTWYHFSEFATGRVANCFGEECNIYDHRTPPRTPNADLQLVSRVIDIKGERHNFKDPAYCIAEFDCPADSWFFKQNSHEDLMPYSIIMEIALQPCGFISAWAGTTLRNPDIDLYFRNLDGSGNLLRQVDLRGKTITNKSTLLSTTAMGGTIIQSFEFELSTDGELFYTGTAVFGYFKKEALTHQLGLDNGKVTQGWHQENNIADANLTLIDLRKEDMQHKFYDINPAKPHYHIAGPQLRLVDTVRIVDNGGKDGKGYIYGERNVDESDWFFACHFHQDPVMPGSLGVEAMYEILQVYALQNDLGKQFKNPRFSHSLDEVIWKYRGQITPANKQMSLDLHITNIEVTDDCVKLLADGNLSKDGLRIYELKDLVFCITDADA